MPVTVPADFSDRVSPVLVKELRQGLRAKTFIALFLGLQIFLAVMLLSAGAASGTNQAGSIISGTIFLFFAIAVLLIQPLRGINALAGEVKDRTIEMMVLTRLTAWRIVFGKWIAIVGQSALLFATIIPYLILRYFFGGMNLVGELMFLLLLFLTSMGLTAVTIGLSGSNSVLIRGLLPILGLPVGLWMMMMFTFASRMGGGVDLMEAVSLSTKESRIGVGVYVLAITYLGGSMLSLGASMISPAAENHAVLRRLVALVLMVAALAAGLFGGYEEELQVLLVFVIAVPALVTAFVEFVPLVDIVRRPFQRLGPPGKVLGWFFYPCWPSGLLFGVVFTALSLLALAFHNDASAHHRWDDEEWTVILGMFGALMFPAVWQAFLFRGEGQRLGHYLMLLVGSFTLWGILTVLSDAMNSSAFLWGFAWHPLAYVAMLEEGDFSDSLLLTGVVLCDVVIAGILLFRALAGLMSAERALDAAASPESDS